ALKGSLSSSSSSSKKQSSSASTKKKSSANSTGVNEGGKRRSTVAKRSSKIPSVGVTAPSPVSESTSENVEKCNGKASRTAGLKEAEPAKEASISSKIPPGLHDDFSSIAFDSADGRPVTASTLTSKELPTKASVDANLPQRAAKPVNVVRPTNGGRPLSALNGDLTPAEACELKASLGKTNTKHLASSLSSAPPPPIHVAGQPDNVWTARNLTVHANTEPKSSPAPQTPPPTSLSEKSSPKDEDTEKPKNCSASTTSTKLVKSGPSEKRKKQSKGADSLKQKVASSASEVGLGDMKIAKKDQHLGGNLPAGNLPPAATATTLDVTEQAPIFLLSPTPGTSHPSQHPYYFGPPFYAAGGPHPSTFFAAPRHTHFGPPAPSPCFIPPPPPPSHFQQTHHSPTPPPPYFFSPANPAAVVAGTPYLSFQLPPPPISHGLPAHLHAGGPNSAGTPVLGVPHTIPFVAQAATAGGGTMALGEEERNAIIQVLSKIGPPEISSVDCRSVTINISVPENLSIGVQEQPLEDTSKAKGNFNGHKEEFNAEECSRVGVEDADTVQASSPNGPSGSDAAECPPTPSTAKLWSIPPSELRFALYLAERNENFVCVYVGEATCILLQDLRPGVQYNIKVCCMYEGLCGGISESTEFVTLATKPACPRPPNVFSRTKSTLSVRWAVPADNGAKITSYCLQYAAITKGGFVPVEVVFCSQCFLRRKAHHSVWRAASAARQLCHELRLCPTPDKSIRRGISLLFSSSQCRKKQALLTRTFA
uniref:Fibronectin type-III domain-containing protein n=1 Tax=Mesocestoides corti TaxID=53468 RepID=A0A5K3ESZ9_MESCO